MKFAPADSAMFKVAETPEVAGWTELHEMLRHIEYFTSLLVYSKTKDARTGANPPEIRPRPKKPTKPQMKLEAEDGETLVIGGEGVSIEVMRARLGWDENDQPIQEG